MSTVAGYYPPYNFYFKVEFPNLKKNEHDNRFQSVSGLSVEYDMDTYKEGGEHRFEHKLPIRAKYPDLVLKRGLLVDSEVIKWCKDAFENMIFLPTTVVVKLLNDKNHEPLKTWNIVNAWPKKWSLSDLNAQDNAIAVETLELSYRYFTVIS